MLFVRVSARAARRLPMLWGSLLIMVSMTTTTMVTEAAVKLDGEKKLFRALLDDYEPAVRPRRDPSEAVEIDIDFELNQIKELVRKQVSSLSYYE